MADWQQRCKINTIQMRNVLRKLTLTQIMDTNKNVKIYAALS